MNSPYSKPVAIVLSVVVLVSGFAVADSRDDPSVADDIGEMNPQTEGMTELPPQVDIHSAWFMPSSDDEDAIEIHLRVRDLTVPLATGGQPFVNDLTYRVTFGLPADAFTSEDCQGATEAFVQFRVFLLAFGGGAGVDTSNLFVPARTGCWTGGTTGDSPATVSVDWLADEFVITVPRDSEDFDLAPGTTISDPEVQVATPEKPIPGDEAPQPPRYVYDTAGPGTAVTV